MCVLFTCCYVRFRCDSDCVCHVLMAVVVALCSLKASVLNTLLKVASYHADYNSIIKKNGGHRARF